MPKIDNSKARGFDNIPGVHFTEMASPSRGTSETSLWRTRVEPGRDGLVHHMTREELIVALAGEGRIRIAGEEHLLSPGDVFAVPAFVDFALECAGEAPFEAMAVLPVGGRVVIANQPSFQPAWSV